VFAVEPQPYAARAIRISAALNGFEHLRVEEAAVCDEEGTMPFFENRKAVSSGLVDYYGVAEGRRVPVRTIDSLALQHALDRLDLIKLDVEGVEHKVLLGAETSIARFRPLVVFESWAVDDPNYVGVWETLTSWGYRVFDLVGRNRLQELERLTPSYNLLAAPPERLERLEGFIGAPVVADWGDQEAEAVTAA
jgi:FkbM family methyltransferase